MRWSYFKNIRNLNVKSFFKKKNLKTKEEIKSFLDEKNFTFSKEELNVIYEEVIPKEPEPLKKPKTIKSSDRKQPVLSQKKKSVRSRSKRKSNVSKSLDTKGWNRRMV